MKWLRVIVCFVSILLFPACSNNSSGGRDRGEVSSTNSQETFKEFYKKLDLIRLPFSPASSAFWERVEFLPFPSNIYPLVYDTTDVRTNARIAKLPSIHGFNVMMIYYQDKADSGVAELYTLKDTTTQIDRLRIYGVEIVPDNGVGIRQEFLIDKDFRIRTSKYLQDLLIEQIYYSITDEGHFEEIRDGKTPIIAYEMYLNSDSLLVESFIWDTTSAGGLMKKDLEQNTYDINDYRE